MYTNGEKEERMSLQQKNITTQHTTLLQPQESTAAYKIYLFGPFRVVRENQPLGEPVWRRNKAKSLLKWFILNEGQLFSSEQLIKLFWPDSTTDAARSLHVAIHYLRHTLEPDLSSGHQSRFIRRNKNNFYWFERGDSWWSDISEIHYSYAAAREAEQHNKHELALSHYRAIIGYCNRGFLPEDTYEDTFSIYRRQYERIYTHVLERLIDLYTSSGNLDEVLAYSHQALLQDPYCEPAFKAIVMAYFQQGDMTSAKRKLDDFQSFLGESLDIELSENIRAVD